MNNLIQDMRYGLRMLAKSPGFTVAAILTLALGIGANATIFSMVNTLLLRPLPVNDPGQIQDLFPQQKNDTPLVQFSIPNFRDIRSQSTGVYSDVIAHTYGIDGLAVNGKSDRVVTEYVSGNFFSMFGLKPALGRLLLPSEGETPMADPVIVLSYSYWRTRFGGDAGVMGKQVSVDGHSMTVVGVAPEGFTGLNPFVSIQGYMPLAMMPIAGYPADIVSNRQNRTDRPSSDLSEEQPAESSTERQHHALSEKLTDQAAAPCSECGSNRHFALANRGAHQQEVRYVRARQQQDQSREALEEYGSN